MRYLRVAVHCAAGHPCGPTIHCRTPERLVLCYLYCATIRFAGGHVFLIPGWTQELPRPRMKESGRLAGRSASRTSPYQAQRAR